MLNGDLNDKNFILYAAKYYDNPHCEDMEEFYNDLLIPIHLKKLFTRYHVNGDLKERLIVNHVISFFNVFHPIAASKMLFFKIEPKYHSYLKTVLVYLQRCPHTIKMNGNEIKTTTISTDVLLLHKLKQGLAINATE